jgi:hypothetical protein
MSEDDVLREVRSAREAYVRAHGFDVRAMVADLRERDAHGDWPVVRLAPRRPTGTGRVGNSSLAEPGRGRLPDGDR